MKHLNILIVYFIYIKFSLYKFQDVSTYYTGLSTCQNNQLYNSISYSCFYCNDGKEIEIDNICYKFNEGNVSSIYVENKIYVNVDKEIPNNKKRTAFDFNGNLFGEIMSASNTIDADTGLLQNHYADDFSSTSGYTSSYFQIGQDTINIIEFSDNDGDGANFYYYYHACYQGLFIEYCQFLANLCTLCIYNSQCYACQAIEKINDRIFDDKDKLFGGSYQEYSHFLKFNESFSVLKNKKINTTQTSLDSEDNDNTNKLDLYLAK